MNMEMSLRYNLKLLGRGSVAYLPGTFGGGAGDSCVVGASVGGLPLGPLGSSAGLSAGVRA